MRKARAALAAGMPQLRLKSELSECRSPPDAPPTIVANLESIESMVDRNMEQEFGERFGNLFIRLENLMLGWPISGMDR